MARLNTKLDTLLGETMGYNTKALIKHMEENGPKSSFLNSLLMQLNSKGDLSRRQWEVLNEGYNRDLNKKAAAQDQEKNAPKIDLARIKEMFDTAKKNGLDFPKLRVLDIIISMAPDNGANAGALYVKVKKDGQNTYAGKLKDGLWLPVYAFAKDDELKTTLENLAKDPQKTAAMHGHKTGRCSMCGKKLTDPKSVELGIGPVCITNWGVW